MPKPILYIIGPTRQRCHQVALRHKINAHANPCVRIATTESELRGVWTGTPFLEADWADCLDRGKPTRRFFEAVRALSAMRRIRPAKPDEIIAARGE